jgi:hypothetical protein
LRRACWTTTCIGPVTGPTRTRTFVITPLPTGGCIVSPVVRSFEVIEQVGTGLKRRIWLQAVVLSGARLRLVPNETPQP